jgi:hypothetical protein
VYAKGSRSCTTFFNNVNKNVKTMQEEIWKDIPDYEGYYQVSNLGRVKSLPKKWGRGNGYVKPEFFKKICKYFDGYEYTQLSIGTHRKKHKIHRLVAIAFIPNPEKKPQVNHINGVKHDNRVVNLEWATQSENIKHAYLYKLQTPKKGRENKLSKPIIQYDINGLEINRYGSIREATRVFGGNIKCYRKNLQGVTKTYMGYVWIFEK